MDLTKLKGFTPGPWRADTMGKFYCEDCDPEEYRGQSHCPSLHIVGLTEKPNTFNLVAVLGDGKGIHEQANAALIAAAPDLLALAKLGVELAEAISIARREGWYEDNSGWPAIEAQARALLKLAEGGEK